MGSYQWASYFRGPSGLYFNSIEAITRKIQDVKENSFTGKLLFHKALSFNFRLIYLLLDMQFKIQTNLGSPKSALELRRTCISYLFIMQVYLYIPDTRHVVEVGQTKTVSVMHGQSRTMSNTPIVKLDPEKARTEERRHVSSLTVSVNGSRIVEDLEWQGNLVTKGTQWEQSPRAGFSVRDFGDDLMPFGVQSMQNAIFVNAGTIFVLLLASRCLAHSSMSVYPIEVDLHTIETVGLDRKVETSEESGVTDAGTGVDFQGCLITSPSRNSIASGTELGRGFEAELALRNGKGSWPVPVKVLRAFCAVMASIVQPRTCARHGGECKPTPPLSFSYTTGQCNGETAEKANPTSGLKEQKQCEQ
ncbi:hypothetical protein MJT46_010293 [Ovis ammon polii x Ovis aries]|nr:hypothetical protein MJT46_010293 [Ovis ammon polii x Ovis aries]